MNKVQIIELLETIFVCQTVCSVSDTILYFIFKRCFNFAWNKFMYSAILSLYTPYFTIVIIEKENNIFNSFVNL